jgi:hypothetical protein
MNLKNILARRMQMAKSLIKELQEWGYEFKPPDKVVGHYTFRRARKIELRLFMEDFQELTASYHRRLEYVKFTLSEDGSVEFEASIP